MPPTLTLKNLTKQSRNSPPTKPHTPYPRYLPTPTPTRLQPSHPFPNSHTYSHPYSHPYNKNQAGLPLLAYPVTGVTGFPAKLCNFYLYATPSTYPYQGIYAPNSYY